MGGESLEEDAGMLFVFDKEDFYSFWMKNTLMPLDMIWINENNKIVYIQKNARPCETEKCQNYATPEKAKYVLEINAGLADKYGIKIGDIVNSSKNT
ncbi:MAG: DUF192 domain-containing protein, partial [bacterium]|nr:DUF192 domain-containing protein [bacterium]